MRILVIEDNHQTASMISLGLKQSGHVVLTAYDGESGLDMVMHEKCDILVLDLMLPDIDGLEVLSRIRKSNIPWIPSPTTPSFSTTRACPFLSVPSIGPLTMHRLRKASILP
jgi:CheY-like chemotaxis protein